MLSQHNYFPLAQKEDPFILEYMNLIGHHEFGLNQIPFVYQKGDNLFKQLDNNSTEYWTRQWINSHGWILLQNFAKEKHLFKTIRNPI